MPVSERKPAFDVVGFVWSGGFIFRAAALSVGTHYASTLRDKGMSRQRGRRFVKKKRLNKKLERRSNLIGSKSALPFSDEQEVLVGLLHRCHRP